jgi:hypothetical protein
MDFFLGGEFSKYGTEVLAMTEKEPEDRVDPMARVFPKVTKCTFHKFGPSGTVEVSGVSSSITRKISMGTVRT